MNTLLFLIWSLFLTERVWKYASIEQFFRRKLSSTEVDSSLISILQPILSGDPTLWDCLARNLQMNTCYQTEFLWLIDEDDEVARVGCENLIAQTKNCHIRLLFLPPASDGISPKTFKLITGLKEAKGEIVAILDDDTIIPDGGLEECIPFLNLPNIGLAFGLPYYINFSNFWSTLVSCFVNGNSLLTYIPYTFLMPPFTINGMFYVVKRDILDSVGGFLGLEHDICDDYAIAQRFRSHGYQLAQTPLRHGISTQVEDAEHYFNLLNRWFIFPQVSLMNSASWRELSVFYPLVLLPNFFPLSVTFLVLILHNIESVLFGMLYFGFSYYMMFQFNHKYLNQVTPDRKIAWILIIQIFLPVQMISSLLSPKKINWRGHIMEVDRLGKFTFIQRRTT